MQANGLQIHNAHCNTPPPTLNRESVLPTAHSLQPCASETVVHALGTPGLQELLTTHCSARDATWM
ncbi:hypothetical protein A6R68_21780, partial [Neotoma lepida]